MTPGTRYGYRLGIREGETESFAGEVWVEVPTGLSLALTGMEPNPASVDVRVAFSLPDARPTSIELIDLAGRRLRSIQVGSRGAGRHVLSLGKTGSLPAGVYLIRLLRDGQALVVKGVVTP